MLPATTSHLLSPRRKDDRIHLGSQGQTANLADGRLPTAIINAQLTRDTTPKGEKVDWSPDGKQLTYEAGNDIWVVGADGKNPRNLTHSKEVEFAPTWAPDGEEIAFVRIDGSKKLVHVMNNDGSHAHPVGGNGAQLAPTWQGLR